MMEHMRLFKSRAFGIYTLCSVFVWLILERTNSNPHLTLFLLTHETAGLHRPQDAFDKCILCTYMYQSSQDCHLYSLPRPQLGAVVFGIWKMTSWWVYSLSNKFVPLPLCSSLSSLPFFLTVFIVAVAPTLLIWPLAAVVSTFITFHFDLIRVSCIFVPTGMLRIVIVLLVANSLSVFFFFDLDFYI